MNEESKLIKKKAFNSLWMFKMTRKNKKNLKKKKSTAKINNLIKIISTSLFIILFIAIINIFRRRFYKQKKNRIL